MGREATETTNEKAWRDRSFKGAVEKSGGEGYLTGVQIFRQGREGVVDSAEYEGKGHSNTLALIFCGITLRTPAAHDIRQS